jgi:hypothetical protein
MADPDEKFARCSSLVWWWLRLKPKAQLQPPPKTSRKKLGPLPGWDEPEIQEVRYGLAVPDLFRIS